MAPRSRFVRSRVKTAGREIAVHVSSSSRGESLPLDVISCRFFGFMKHWFLPTVSLLWLCACALPQQIDVMEREQRRMRNDLLGVQKDLDALRADVGSVRGTMADTRANTQQLQRDVSAMKERIEEARVQLGRQVG